MRFRNDALSVVSLKTSMLLVLMILKRLGGQGRISIRFHENMHFAVMLHELAAISMLRWRAIFVTVGPWTRPLREVMIVVN
jgi:hypothetical protein